MYVNVLKCIIFVRVCTLKIDLQSIICIVPILVVDTKKKLQEIQEVVLQYFAGLKKNL